MTEELNSRFTYMIAAAGAIATERANELIKDGTFDNFDEALDVALEEVIDKCF